MSSIGAREQTALGATGHVICGIDAQHLYPEGARLAASGFFGRCCFGAALLLLLRGFRAHSCTANHHKDGAPNKEGSYHSHEASLANYGAPACSCMCLPLLAPRSMPHDVARRISTEPYSRSAWKGCSRKFGEQKAVGYLRRPTVGRARPARSARARAPGGVARPFPKDRPHRPPLTHACTPS